jgi:PAS domain S-box-containing protein
MTTESQKVGDTSSVNQIAAETVGSDGAALFDRNDVNWQFFEASPDGVKILDREGRLIFVNGNALKAMEADDYAAIASHRWIELWPEASRTEVEHAFQQACEGSSARFTALRPTQKGTPRWWDVVISPIKDSEGRVVNLMSISRDVTPSLTLADTLKRSEQQFQALANNIAQLAWMADATGNLFWLNQRWLDFTGSTLETSSGQGWRLFHHPDHIARVVDKWARCTSEGRVWEDLFPLRGVDGRYRWFLSRAMPVRNAEGKIEFWCGTNTDVTDARRQSQRLRKLARIIELSHEAILVREIGGGIVMWNRGCEELFGYTKAQAKGKSPFELLQPRNLLPPETFDDLILEKRFWSGEVHYTANDGSDVWVDSRQELVSIGDKSLVLESNRDTTERRQSEEVRSLLVAELNHRVKNTLAVVQSIAAQTARASSTPEKFVMRFNGRLQSLANAHNILSEVAWAGAPIVELIESQVAMTGAEAGRVKLDGEPVTLPPQAALQLALILHELSANAMQHGALSTNEGHVAISWTVREGCPRLVELTWRESSGPKVNRPVARGFGLTLIERSKSLPTIKTSIEFEPEGVVARVALEARLGDDARLFNPGQKLMRARIVPPHSRISTQSRILIMDGSLSRALLLEDMLDNAGYAVSGPISSAAAAIDIVAQNSIDLVALDVDEIADKDIVTLLAALADRDIPCIAVGTSARLAQIKAGAFASLVAKPIDRDIFLRAVSSSLDDDLDVDVDDLLI